MSAPADLIRPLGPVAARAFAFVEAELEIGRIALEGACRKKELVEGRALFVWIVRNFGNARLSYPQIGRMLGGRDHTTIINLDRKADEMRRRDADFAELCDRFVLQAAEQQENDHGRTRH